MPTLPPVSGARLWTGRVLSGFAVLFLLFDGGIKLFPVRPVLDSFAEMGFPIEAAVPIGVVELVCVALYALPRTSVLGALLLTGYLGGASAMKARLGDPWLLFPVGFGVLVWAGLFLRDPRLHALLPLRERPPTGSPA